VGTILRMMPGYEEGTQGAEQPPKFLDWGGVNPDEAPISARSSARAPARSWAWRASPIPPMAHRPSSCHCSLDARDGALLHDVYVGTRPDLVRRSRRRAHPITLHYYALGSGGATYYWRVDEISVDGRRLSQATSGPSWLRPDRYRPNPADGASARRRRNADLAAGRRRPEHHVYFGKPRHGHAGAAEVDKGIVTETTLPRGLWRA